MMTGSSFGALLRISPSRAAMSHRRLSSTAAMYSAGVFTFSCPCILTASSEDRHHRATVILPRPTRRDGSGGDGEESPCAGDAFELVLTPVIERDHRSGDEIDDGP
jgi:hypothetical protein